MVLTRAALNECDSRVQALGDAAYEAVSRRVSSFLETFPGASVAEVREFTIEVVTAAVAAYGDAAAACAADLYDQMAEAAGASVSPAILDTSDVGEFIEEQIRYQAVKLVSGDAHGFVEMAAKKAKAQTQRRANSTMTRNVKRDGVRYARVPMGGETCTFCLMLASRGFVYKSAKTAGKGRHYHDNCRCKVVPQFGKGGRATKVEGYDPDELYEQWKKFQEIDSMSYGDGGRLTELDREALKVAYADQSINYGKVRDAIECFTIAAAKLERYALSPEGDVHKSRAFAGYLGYTASDAPTVAARVYEHIADDAPSYKDTTPHGERYTTKMKMKGKDGKTAKVTVG